MNVQLNQTLSWTGDVGAHFDVLVNTLGGATFVKLFDAGASTSVLLSDLFAGVDFATFGTNFDVHVRSKLPDGSLPSAYSTKIAVTVIGFSVPTGLVVT